MHLVFLYSRVVGVDCSDVIYQAMDIVRENGYNDVISLVKGRLEDVDLPIHKVGQEQHTYKSA